MTDWHVAHLGGIAQRGPGLLMTEATAVLPEGRITPQDTGLWSDDQIPSFKRVIEFVHSQNQVVGVQIAHAGRKASTNAPWLESGATDVSAGGWPDNIKGPSNIPFGGLGNPKAMTKEDIEEVKRAWPAAVKRALAAGADYVEIHGAHGYLLSSFFSPLSNNRTDEYGGSFENRIRLPLEIISAVRAVIPESMPLLFRISGSEWGGPDGWKVEDTVAFAKILAERGEVDLLDVSSGGNLNKPIDMLRAGPGYQVPLAAQVKAAVGDKLAVSAVGVIVDGKQANDILVDHNLDAVFVGRHFIKNPGAVWQFAEDIGPLNLKIANQIGWGFGGRGGIGGGFVDVKGRD